MRRTNKLGEYLRARRDLIQPEDVGLTRGDRRRVPGLRREEVAHLAGISAQYYLRLEQGRDQHPSDQVLEALARVLMLDADASAYLRRLAGPVRRPAPRRREEPVAPGLARLVMSRTDLPALVLDGHQDVLLANPLATALSPSHTPGVNAVRAAFLDPEVRNLYRDDWEGIVAGSVAALRALAGPETEDPYLAELVGELSVRSEHFRRLWSLHDARPRLSGSAVLHHPLVGPMELSYEKLAVIGTEDQVLVLFHAAPGSAAEESLTLLSHPTDSGLATRQPAVRPSVLPALPALPAPTD
ncbi:helix-turn-helix transcriptional regulator [Streptomyces sp. 150FB]|uniref:helix-turn-helix domain-containing protein n=1 Tax=Streptomyces sp. 150FB TaxID=1576605 RepID=UPI000D145EEC|nr:helix-turn-helix transcriptional regulator [Streptomyces sp. 150FB]